MTRQMNEFEKKALNEFNSQVIDGMIWDNEIEKWVTPEEYVKEYSKNSKDMPGFEGTKDALDNLSIWK